MRCRVVQIGREGLGDRQLLHVLGLDRVSVHLRSDASVACSAIAQIDVGATRSKFETCGFFNPSRPGIFQDCALGIQCRGCACALRDGDLCICGTRMAGAPSALAAPMLACYALEGRVRADGLAGAARGCPAATHWLAVAGPVRAAVA